MLSLLHGMVLYAVMFFVPECRLDYSVYYILYFIINFTTNRHYATSWKVAGSIPYEVIGFFN
jgi:hypothetical protein